MAVSETDFYSESMVSIKCRICINGTRATRLMAPAQPLALAQTIASFCGSSLPPPSSGSSSHLTSPLVLTLVACLCCSMEFWPFFFLICWHPFWAMVVRRRGGWREGVFGFIAMSHFRVFGTLTGWFSLTQTSREKHNINSKISFTKDSDCKPCTRH